MTNEAISKEWPEQLCGLDAGCTECKTPDDNVIYHAGRTGSKEIDLTGIGKVTLSHGTDNWKCCHEHKLRWYIGQAWLLPEASLPIGTGILMRS